MEAKKLQRKLNKQVTDDGQGALIDDNYEGFGDKQVLEAKKELAPVK